MIDDNQKETPTGADVPERAWFNRLGDSIKDVLTFGTLADANTWAADPANATYATEGRVAWITAENALCVRSGGAWEGITSPVATNTGVMAPVSGNATVSDATAIVTAGVCTLVFGIAPTAAVAAGNVTNVELAVVTAGFRPHSALTRGIQWTSGDHGVYGRILPNGNLNLSGSVAALPAGTVVAGSATYTLN